MDRFRATAGGIDRKMLKEHQRVRARSPTAVPHGIVVEAPGELIANGLAKCHQLSW